jgi:hypothetical protein
MSTRNEDTICDDWSRHRAVEDLGVDPAPVPSTSREPQEVGEDADAAPGGRRGSSEREFHSATHAAPREQGHCAGSLGPLTTVVPATRLGALAGSDLACW